MAPTNTAKGRAPQVHVQLIRCFYNTSGPIGKSRPRRRPITKMPARKINNPTNRSPPYRTAWPVFRAPASLAHPRPFIYQSSLHPAPFPDPLPPTQPHSLFDTPTPRFIHSFIEQAHRTPSFTAPDKSTTKQDLNVFEPPYIHSLHSKPVRRGPTDHTSFPPSNIPPPALLQQSRLGHGHSSSVSV